MDSHLSMSHQVSAICKSCNFCLYRLSSIRRYLTVEATRNAVQALITSRLDYCNSLLAAITSAQAKQLQKMQNKAARLVTRTPRLHHITPVLKQLHWLPLECRIQFKVIVMVFKCLHSEAPSYLYNPVKWTVAFALTVPLNCTSALLVSQLASWPSVLQHPNCGIICPQIYAI